MKRRLFRMNEGTKSLLSGIMSFLLVVTMIPTPALAEILDEVNGQDSDPTIVASNNMEVTENEDGADVPDSTDGSVSDEPDTQDEPAVTDDGAPSSGETDGTPAATVGETPVVDDTNGDEATDEMPAPTRGDVGETGEDEAEPTRGAQTSASVAKIADEYYGSLQEAIDAAQDGDTIVLLDNIDATSAMYSGDTRFNLWISKSITIDGDGQHMIKVKGRGIGVQGANENIDVSIKDVVINNVGAENGRCIDTRGNIGSLTLDGATLSTAECTYTGYLQPLTIGGNQDAKVTVTILNTEIITNADANKGYAITTFNPVDMTITNGTIKGWACLNIKGPDSSAGSTGSSFTINGSDLVSANCTPGDTNPFALIKVEDDNVAISITNANIEVDGTENTQSFVSFQKLDMTDAKGCTVTLGAGNNVTLKGDAVLATDDEDCDLIITGGKFVGDNDGPVDVSKYLADGLIQVETGEVVAETPTTYVAQIDGTKYETLQAALDAAQSDDTIVLLADVELTDATYTGGRIPINKSLTIDGGTHTITIANRGFGIGASETIKVAFKNVTVVNASGSTSGNGRCIDVIAPVNMSIDDSIIDGLWPLYFSDGSDASKVTIDDSTLKSTGIDGGAALDLGVVYFDDDNITVIANNSTFEYSSAGSTWNGIANNHNNGRHGILFKLDEGNTVKLSGSNAQIGINFPTTVGSELVFGKSTVFVGTIGQFYLDEINLCAEEGYVINANGDGTYTFVLGDVYYYWSDSEGGFEGIYSLFDAPFDRNWLSEGEFIKLKKDVTLDKNLSTAASFNLLLDGHVITQGEYTIALAEGVSVTSDTDGLGSLFSAPEGLIIAEAASGDSYTYTATKLPVAQIGDATYSSLADAIAAVPADGTETTITVLADHTIDVTGYALTIPASKSVVLDLSGKTVVGSCESSGTTALIRNLGTLTITDSAEGGRLIGGADPTWTWDGSDDYTGSYASNLIRNEGTLVVNGGTLYNASSGSAAYAIDNYAAGKVTINGGTVDSAKASAIRMFYNNGGALVVTDGTIGHYNSDSDYSYMGIQVMSGSNSDVTVNGGTIAGMYALYSNGAGDSSVAITGGTLDGYVGFGSTGPDTISIAGGQFTEWVGTWGDQTGFVSGGLFAVKPDAEICADGIYPIVNTDEATKDDFPYTVGEAVATVNGESYASLEAAIAAAESGATVKLVANTDESVIVPTGKSITLDLNGKTTTNANTALIVKGELTVVDSSDAKSGLIKSTAYNGISVVGGKLTFESGAVESQEFAVIVLDGGTATIDGGTFTTVDNVVLGTNGTAGRGGNTITVNAGTFNGNIQTAGYVACGIYVANDDTVTVNGGTFNINGGAGIVARAGTVTIPEGSTVEIKTTGDAVGKVGDSRVVVPCSAIVFDSDAGYPGMTTTSSIDVKGGTFISDVVPVVTVGETAASRILLESGSYSASPEDEASFPVAKYPVLQSNGTYEIQPSVASPDIEVLFATATPERTYAYTGSDITPVTGVKVNEGVKQSISMVALYIGMLGDGTELIEGEDYSLRYENNVNPGIATVIITGLGEFEGTSTTREFTIAQATITSVTADDLTYTGAVQTPQNLVVKAGELTLGADDYTYEVSPAEVKDAGTYTVSVTAKSTSNYSGIATGTFTIGKASLADATITVKPQGYTGSAVEPSNADIEVKLGDEIVDPSNYVVRFRNNVNVGSDATITVVATGTGNLTGSKDGTFQIVEAAARIDNTYYPTLAEAVAAANDGDTITMVADEDLAAQVVIDKSVTLDLNGKTLSNTSDIWDTSTDSWSLISVQDGASVTITGDGMLRAKENDCYALDIRDGGKLTIESGTFNGNISAVYVLEGMLAVEGGTFDVQQLDSRKGKAFEINCYDANYANGTAKVTITGGSFVGCDPSANAAETSDNTTDFTPVNLTGVETSNGVWTVVEKQTVEIPQATTGLVYDGNEKIGVRTGEGYTLSGNTEKDAGTYIATATLADPHSTMWSDNTIEDQQVTWTIAKAGATITVDDASKDYGADDPEFSATVDPHVELDYELSRTAGEDAGTYAITATVAESANYDVTVVDGTLTIGRVSITGIEDIADQLYTGSDIEPTIVVKAGKLTVPDESYTVRYLNNKALGEASVLVVANGEDANFYGFAVAHFNIVESNKDALKAAIEKAEAVRVATSDAQGFDLESGSKYVTSAEQQAMTAALEAAQAVFDDPAATAEQIAAATRALTEATTTYQAAIKTAQAAVAKIAAPTAATGLVYNGSEQVCVAEGEGYTLSGDISATNAGGYTAIASLSDPVATTWADGTTADITLSFEIAKANLADIATVGSIDTHPYTGSAIEPDVTVSVTAPATIADTDYTVAFSDNTDPGTATVTVTAAADSTNYTGSVTSSFVIAKGDFARAEVSIDNESFSATYSGEEYEPGVVVFLNGDIVNSDYYTVEYADNVNAGTATITVTAKDAAPLSGSTGTTFVIGRASIEAIEIAASDKTYTGNEQTIDSVTFNGTELTEGTDYRVIYVNNVNVGTATAVVIGKGNFEGETTETFEITEVDKSVLNQAIADATADKDALAVSEDGKDLADGTEYVTPEAKQALADAIAAAQEVLDNPNATAAEVAEAVEAIEAAQDAFDDATKTAAVDTKPLSDAINAAKTDRDGTTVAASASQVPDGEKYVTQAVKDALTKAITDAEEVLNDPKSSQNAIEAATAAVNAAQKAFDDAKQTGTKPNTVSIANARVTVSDKVYDGVTPYQVVNGSITNTVKVTMPDGTVLKERVDYEFVTSDHSRWQVTDTEWPGTVTVTVRGIGNYSGTAEGTCGISEPFVDVNPSTYHYHDVLWMSATGISRGWGSYPNCEYRSMSNVVRCDMAAFLYRLAGEPAYTPSAAEMGHFTDVNTSTPHYREILWMYHAGITTGYPQADGTYTFKPYGLVYRCDMAAFLHRLAGNPSASGGSSFTDVNSGTSHYTDIMWLASTGVSTGFEDGTFRPMNTIKRCDMAAFLHRMYDYELVPTNTPPRD